jgi:uroporphyrinogen-III decarboxylase
MDQYASRLRDAYAIKPNAPFVQREFGYYALDRWAGEGHDVTPEGLAKAAGLEPSGQHNLWELGWCEAGFEPTFPEIVLEDRGEYELVQDFAGRSVLCFKGRRNGFMPEYLDSPVKDMKTWEENCKWRMNPQTPERIPKLDKSLAEAVDAAKRGLMISQRCVGGYMYLRSLMGPEKLLYMFYDDPDLIHDCMQTWFNLADAVTAYHQKQVTFDEFFIGEDICFNTSSLISPDMIKEFLFPYYQQLLTNIKKRQLDQSRHLYFQVDTDGHAPAVLDLYADNLGMDCMSPFEVASGCDVVEIGKQYPNLFMTGGFDKRVLANGKAAIDEMCGRIFPAMFKRGGYIPTCDHGVPEEVAYEDWLHFRKRCAEYA